MGCVNCKKNETIKLSEKIRFVSDSEELELIVTNCHLRELIKTNQYYGTKIKLEEYKINVKNHKKLTDFINNNDNSIYYIEIETETVKCDKFQIINIQKDLFKITIEK